MSSDGLFARKPEVDTFLSSMWGDWIMIAQRDVGSPPSSPWRVTREHRGSPRHVSLGTLLCVSPQPLFKVEVDQAGAGDSRWVHSRPVRTYAPADSPAGAVEKHATTGADQTPGLCPVTPSSEGRPLLAVSGSSWGPVRMSSRALWIVGGGMPLRG